jgi:DNA-binding SARP family transcriptional activator
MDALWPNLSADHAAANFRKAVHYARRALGFEGAIEVRGGVIELSPTRPATIDADAFEREASDAVDEDNEVAAARAAALFGGELLPDDPYEGWTQERRAQLRALYVRTLRTAGLWEQVLEVDPADEQAHRALMSMHFESGNRHVAIRQFERLRDVLREQLGVGPDPETVSLYEVILAAEGRSLGDPIERARALLAEGLVRLNTRDLYGAMEAADAARAIAVEANLLRELGEASGLLGMVAHAEGRWRELFREEFAKTLQEPPDHAMAVIDAHLCLAESSLYGPEGTHWVEAFARELLDIADARDSVHGSAVATMMLGEAALFAGRLDESEVHLARSAELYERVGALSGRVLSLERLAEAALARPDGRTKADRLLRRALPLAERAPLAPHLITRVLGAMVLRPKDPSRAADVVARADHRLSDLEVCHPCSMGFHVAASIALARVGDLGGSARHLESAERISGMWQGGPWQAAVWEARAHLRFAEGGHVQAAALFREAADAFARTGHPMDEARCRTAAA